MTSIAPVQYISSIHLEYKSNTMASRMGVYPSSGILIDLKSH